MFAPMSPPARALRAVKLSVKYKLFLTLMLTSALASLAMFFFIRYSLDRGFMRYVNEQQRAELHQLARRVTAWYAREGSWERLRGDRVAWDALLRPEESHGASPGQGSEGPPGGMPAGELAPPHGTGAPVALYDDKLKPVFGPPKLPRAYSVALKFKERTVGRLVLLPSERLTRARDMRFLREQTQVFAGAALTVGVFSLLVSLPIAGYLLRPIEDLTAGTHKLTAGEYATRIPVKSGDELGQLCADFNQLARALEDNEQARQRWVADIAHELRTPLSVLQGDIEALQDGVRAMTPAALSVLNDEVAHLTRLVSDLYELSMSDIGALNYKLHRVDPVGLLGEAVELHQPRFEDKQLELSLTLPVGACEMNADPDRLQQLFRNLLENSLRYTEAPGRLAVNAELGGGQLKISFSDSAPGLEAEDYPQLFDRLYRAESSRNRATGGAGLGLAICKNIVDAHEGSIRAVPSELSGVRVEIEFKVEKGSQHG